MYAHAQRKHAIQSLDDLLKVLIAYSYFLDPYMIRFLVRSIAQIQLGQLKDVDPSMSLRILVFCLVLVHLGPVGRHLFQPLEPTDMLLLDFIGRLKPAPQYLVAFLDVAIFLLQLIMLFIAYETVRQHPDMPDPLAASRSQSSPEIAGDPNERTPLASHLNAIDQTHSPLDPIFHLRLRTTFQRLVHPPPSAPRTDLPTPATSALYSRQGMAARMLLGLAVPSARSMSNNAENPVPRGASRQPTAENERRVPGGLSGDW
ncbi:hypothetical protein M407DRAFT_121387 [Tulasnella calospora MUT 4182]|uniref:DUF1746 domain-containing protein n=1 Tax=Tulasnella calospora MUT 4182 TaxID=1051891 RepID=A0A0C3QIH3_9AGAM|nr:hypothetical protein M407DRAFT_121387 [Tulasnella calospora MUT 4182]